MAKRDWSKMTSNILRLIYSKLPPDLHYYCHFRSVTKEWSSLVFSSDTQKNIPWLIECENPWFVSGSHSEEQNLRFHSFVTGQTCKICLPDLFRGLVHNGTGHGHLLVKSQAGNLFTFNPITREQVILPSLDEGLWIRSLACCFGTQKDSPAHIIVCRVPTISNSGGWTVVTDHQERSSWTYINVPPEICATSCTVCHWRGWICATQEGLPTGVFDIGSGDIRHVIQPPENENATYSSYIVESGQDLLRVSRYFQNEESQEIECCRFRIYKLSEDVVEQRLSWAEISKIGNQIVFLENWANGFSMAAPPGQKGDCIYFIVGDGSVGRYDIGTSTVERVACPLTRCSWFKPCLC